MNSLLHQEGQLGVKAFAHPEEATVVLGSLNANPQDRTLERSSVRPVQLIMDGNSRPVPSFDSWGKLGVSSLAWHPGRSSVLYVSTGDKLLKIDLPKQRVSLIAIPNLHDVHEMTVIGDTLWLANTGSDEVVAFDLTRGRISDRRYLAAYDSVLRGASITMGSGEGEMVDRFHCNQVFEGFDGHVYALVHHVSGYQLIRRIAQKLIKSQGNGGVINLSTGEAVPLRLKAPHSVRKVRGEYWLCDSGNGTINVYNPDWRLKDTVYAKGWGRGADVSESLGIFFVGISATRRRYLDVVSSGRKVPNMVQAYFIKDRALAGEVELSAVEQVNNLYKVPREVALSLLDLRAVGIEKE